MQKTLIIGKINTVDSIEILPVNINQGFIFDENDRIVGSYSKQSNQLFLRDISTFTDEILYHRIVAKFEHFEIVTANPIISLSIISQ